MEENMANTPNKARAELVKQERTKRAFTQSHLAELAGVTLRTIQRLEKDGIASFETLMGVASAFDVDVEYLNPSPRTPSKKSEQSNEKEHPLKVVCQLPRLKSGKDITDIVGGLDGEDCLERIYDQINDKKAVDLVSRFFRLLTHVASDWRDYDSALKLEVEFKLSQELKKLELIGFFVFGIKREVPKEFDYKTKVKMITIFIVPSNYPKIVRNEKLNSEMIPSILNNIARQHTFKSHEEVLRPQNLSQL